MTGRFQVMVRLNIIRGMFIVGIYSTSMKKEWGLYFSTVVEKWKEYGKKASVLIANLP